MPDLEKASQVVEKDAPASPILRGLLKLADLRPVIAVDTREQAPLKFTRLRAVERALFTGDYSIVGLEESFAVERKSLDDIANCCLSSNRDRFERELHRLRGYQFKRLVIVVKSVPASRLLAKLCNSLGPATVHPRAGSTSAEITGPTR
jgi:ERCC4-type nuclease